MPSQESALGVSPQGSVPAGGALAPDRAHAASSHHLRTDHLLHNLRRRVVSGGVVTFGGQAAGFAINLIGATVLARLLAPEDFGLVAMVTTITGLLRAFKDGGLSTATVQRENITHAQVSNLFWINVALSGFLSLLIAGLAPLVAWFYHEPRLVNVTLAFSFAFAVSGAVVQHQALLKRQMRYGVLTSISISSAALGLVVGLAMAQAGLGYWSLVGMQLSNTIAELILTLCISGWRPERPARGCGTRSLIRFGASLTGANVLRRMAAGSDNLLLGRFYGADSVGLYTRGTVLLMRPLEEMLIPLEGVFTPVLSRLQADPERYRRVFLRAYGAVALVSFPAAGLGLALAQPIVRVLLGPRWDAVSAIFAGFSFAGLFLPLYLCTMWLLNTQGRAKDILTTASIYSATTVAAVAIGLKYGPAGVALALSVAGLAVRLPVQFWIVSRSGPVTASDLWGVFGRYLPSWAASAVAASAVLHILRPMSAAIQLCFSVPAGVAASALLLLLIPAQRREARYLLGALRNLEVRS